MRKVLKELLALLFVCILSAQLFAAEGTVTYIKGKVEVKRGEDWVSLRVGDKVSQSEIISTGFQSEAKVKLMDSVLYLGPVTRVSLDQLSASSDRDSVNVYLSTGTVRSKVNRTNNKSVSYTVRTPIAVASVRGTDFSIGSDGKMKSNTGSVAYTPEDENNTKKKSKASKDEKDEKDGKEDKDEKDKSGAEEKSKGKSESNDDSLLADGKASEKSVVADDAANNDKGTSENSGFYQSDKARKMASSEKLPRETIVRSNQSISCDAARRFEGVTQNTTAAAMSIVGSVSSESSKSAVGQSNAPAIAAVSSSIAGSVNIGPKTGSIKVLITEPASVKPVVPATGNVSVEVVLPK